MISADIDTFALAYPVMEQEDAWLGEREVQKSCSSHDEP